MGTTHPFMGPPVAASADALQVAHPRKRLVFDIREGAPRSVVEQRKLFEQLRRMHVGQRLNQVLKHRAQAAQDLYAVAPVLPYLCDGEVYEVFPVRRAV